MESEIYPHLWIPILKDPISQLTSNTLKPKWIFIMLSNQPGSHNFHGCITFQFQIYYSPHVCHSIFERTASSWNKIWKCIFVWWVWSWKNALCKTKDFHKCESVPCHKDAVTMLTQPGHIDEQLKRQIKCRNEENRNSHKKIVQRIYCHFHQSIDVHKSKQDEE